AALGSALIEIVVDDLNAIHIDHAGIVAGGEEAGGAGTINADFAGPARGHVVGRVVSLGAEGGIVAEIAVVEIKIGNSAGGGVGSDVRRAGIFGAEGREAGKVGIDAGEVGRSAVVILSNQAIGAGGFAELKGAAVE